jgi:hypothetical protein
MTNRRRVLLVGSMPFQDEKAAMAKAIELAGPQLMTLPDGEIGERTEQCPNGDRSAWVQTIMDRCERDTENWTITKPGVRNAGGYAADYDSAPRLKPNHPPKEMVEHLEFGWNDAARSSYPLFKQVRNDADLPELRFQVGLPTGVGAAFGILGPLNAMRYGSAFNERLALEANDILQFTDPGDVTFQVEVPGELALAYKLPKPLVGIATKKVIDLVDRINVGAPIGLHLCFGDLNNDALISSPSLDKAVNFTNDLIKRWPSKHPLAYVHFPLAEASAPPPTDRSFYEPLAEINLPAGTRLVAGFVHDKCSDAELRQIRDHIEAVRGEPVDIACSCGLGRRDRVVATSLIEACAALAS